MRRLILVLAVSAAACGGGDNNKGAPAPGPSAGGSPGGDTGGTGGNIVYPPGTGGASGSGGGSGSGGSAGTGGASGSGGSGGNVVPPASDGGASDAAPPPSSGAGGDFSNWYEAEAMPPNEKAARSEVHVNPARKCATTPPKPGDDCNSGGGQVTWITQGRMGWLQYNQVAVPADGMYDVTWWYHCGNNDNFGDRHCGGQTNPPTTASGCRPHNFIINGTELPGNYHFPCFGGSFGIIRAATTRLPLKAGNANTIRVYPKSRDSADMDALQVQPAGKGIGPLIMPNDVSGVN